MNLLINAVGKRRQLIELFFSAVSSTDKKIFLGDASVSAPAGYGHNVIQTPLISDKNYEEDYNKIFAKHKITHVLSLIDTDVFRLKEVAKKNNVVYLGPSVDVLEICRDKYQFYTALKEKNIRVMPTSLKPEYKYPLISKDRSGSRGSNFRVHENSDFLPSNLSDCIYQPYAQGKHVDVDFISYNNCFLHAQKEIIYKQNGESYLLQSLYENEIEELILKFIETFNYNGVGNADVWFYDGAWVLMEVNPRFGGNYPATHLQGADFISILLNGMPNNKKLHKKNMTFVKSLVIEGFDSE